MPLTTGVFHAGFNPAELNERSFAAAILRLFPNGSAPLFGLTGLAKRSTAKATTHGYFTKTMVFPFAQINAGGGYAAGITVFVVDSTSGLAPKQVLHNTRTKENMRIISVDSATQITVTREFGRIAAAAINDDDKLVVVGTAFEEGSARPIARSITMVHVSTFTQIFRNAWALTDTARAFYTSMPGVSNVAENKEDCMMFHAAEMESAIFFGQAKMDTSGPTPLHSTQGIIDAMEQYAPANTNAAAATTNYGQLVSLVEPAFKYSSNIGSGKERTLFGGQTAVRVLNDIGRKNGMIQMEQTETSFGMMFTRFRFYKGSINIIEHPIFNGLENMAGLAVGIDLPALALAYMDGRDTRSEEYGGVGRNNANGIDAQGGSLTTEFATELINPLGCFVIYDLVAGVGEAVLTDEIPAG